MSDTISAAPSSRAAPTAGREADFWISVVVPLRNCRDSIGKALDGLHRQKVLGRCELILICDAISDDTLEIIHAHPLTTHWDIVELSGRGLAQSYNFGWKSARAEYVLFMHSDCYPVPDDAMMLMFQQLKRESAVAVRPLVGIPDGDWETMNFWDRVTSARFRHAKPAHNLMGKFDLFQRAALEKIGGFDEQRFLNAAEDADIALRLSAIGKIVSADALVIHAHVHPPSTRFKSVLRKQVQIGEGFGALVRKHGLAHAFSREMLPVTVVNTLKLILPLAVFVPPISIYAAVLLVLFSLYYVRWAVFTADWRVVLLPIVVPLIFEIYGLAMIRGFLRGRQSFDYIQFPAKNEPAKNAN